MWLSEFTAAKVLSYYNSQLPTSVATFIVTVTHCLTLSSVTPKVLAMQNCTEASNVSELECKEAIWKFQLSEWLPLLFSSSSSIHHQQYRRCHCWCRCLHLVHRGRGFWMPPPGPGPQVYVVLFLHLAPSPWCRWASPHAQATSAVAGLRVSWMYSWNKTRKRQ